MVYVFQTQKLCCQPTPCPIRKDATSSLQFHDSCTCKVIFLLMSMSLSPVRVVQMSYWSINDLKRTSLTSRGTRCLYLYGDSPRVRDPSPTRQSSVKNCCDMLWIRSLVTDSRAVELSPRLSGLALPLDNHFFISGITEEHTYSEQ